MTIRKKNYIIASVRAYINLWGGGSSWLILNAYYNVNLKSAKWGQSEKTRNFFTGILVLLLSFSSMSSVNTNKSDEQTRTYDAEELISMVQVVLVLVLQAHMILCPNLIILNTKNYFAMVIVNWCLLIDFSLV